MRAVWRVYDMGIGVFSKRSHAEMLRTSKLQLSSMDMTVSGRFRPAVAMILVMAWTLRNSKFSWHVASSGGESSGMAPAKKTFAAVTVVFIAAGLVTGKRASPASRTHHR
eukprot:355359-Chlamydomonas_euryale.AAC.12